MKENAKKIIQKGIDEIIPYDKNPRKNDKAVDKVANSIRAFGFQSPIIIDEQNIIICGHTRFKAAKKLGLKKVPCIVATGLTDAEIRAYRIADNKVGELAEWDNELLASELDLCEMNMSEFGDFGDIICEEEKEIIEDEVSYDVQPICKRGDIWQLGNHRLLCGDSTSPDDVSRLMGDERADLWLTDPPYNVAYTGGTKDALTIQNDDMDDESFRQFLGAAYAAADSVLKKGAAFYIWHADSEGFNFRGALRDVGWKVRECLIWVKNAFVMGRQDYQWKHEPCLYGWKEGASHNWYSDRSQSTVLEFARPNRNGEHPTMKPVELFCYLIGNSTRKGEIVLDSFGGSGTTLIACEQLNRKCYMMELDEHYCDVIIERFKRFNPEAEVKKINNE